MKSTARGKPSETGIDSNTWEPDGANDEFVGGRHRKGALAGSLAFMLGSVALQGRPVPPHPRWSVPLRVGLMPQSAGPAVVCTPTADQSGNFSCPNLLPGVYTVCVKHSHTLQNCQSVTLAAGDNLVNFGTLREGDANDDNMPAGAWSWWTSRCWRPTSASVGPQPRQRW